MKDEIIIFENQKVKLEVNLKDETVWLNTKQMSTLFHKEESNIRKHIINIFNEQELIKDNNVQKMHVVGVKQNIPFYSLDVIISVGYRVKSKEGTKFRIWANKVLKDHLLKGYSINQQRLDYLEKTVKLIDIANRMDERLKNNEAKELLKVIGNYSKALDLLDNYDNKSISRPKGVKTDVIITYEECLYIINKLKFNETSKLFAIEKNKGLDSIINTLYQTYDNKELYPTFEEKASNLLYLLVKNHIFIDGNKRIAATIFIYFLNINNRLYIDNKQVIDNNTLVALTLLIAESNPKEKDVITDLVMNFLSN